MTTFAFVLFPILYLIVVSIIGVSFPWIGGEVVVRLHNAYYGWQARRRARIHVKSEPMPPKGIYR